MYNDVNQLRLCVRRRLLVFILKAFFLKLLIALSMSGCRKEKKLTYIWHLSFNGIWSKFIHWYTLVIHYFKKYNLILEILVAVLLKIIVTSARLHLPKGIAEGTSVLGDERLERKG